MMDAQEYKPTRRTGWKIQKNMSLPIQTLWKVPENQMSRGGRGQQ